MSLAAGDKLGHYEILAPLGAGGMGEVYRARDTKLKRDVALKVLPAAVANNPERMARFQREAEVLASLNHPNIAAIYGVEDRSLAMELVEGESPQGPLGFDDAWKIVAQIADALEYAHERGIVHRDLKPANVKVTPDGVVKLLDFGLAKAFNDPTDSSAGDPSLSPTMTLGATVAGTIMGTAAYMAPEQAKGKRVDKRADIWAFGVVLYELLTGDRLFKGEDVSDVLAHVLTQEPDLERVPAKSRRLLGECLQKDPKLRLRDIGDAKRLLLGEAPRVVVAARSRPWVWMASTAILLLALAAGAVWHFRPSPAPGITRFSITLGEGQQLTTTTRAFLAISPDGSQIAYVANLRLYLRSLPELEARAIPGTDLGSTPGNIAFSPDNKSLAFSSTTDGTLKRIAISGGTAVTICQNGGNPTGLDWNDAGIVFTVGKDILRVSPNGGTPEIIVHGKDGEQITRPSMLPGGESVLFTLENGTAFGTADWDKAKIVVQTIKSGARKTLHEGGSDGRYLPTGQIVYALGATLFAIPFDLKRLEATGGAVPLLEGVRRGATGSAHFSFSANGSLIYAPGGIAGLGTNQNSLVLMDRKGALEPLKLAPGPYTYPRVSRDGKRVAYESDEGGKDSAIWVAEISAEHQPIRLTLTGTGANRFPIWSWDGTRVAFQSDREGDQGIWWQSADGNGAAERLTKPEKGVSHIPDSWSPDGQTFSFTEAKGDAEAVWTFSLRDKKATPFAAAPAASLGRSAFSPDGHWIAYQQRDMGTNQAQIYVKTYPASATTYQISKDGTFNRHPVWSRDGKELLHISGAGAQVTDWSITEKPTFTFRMLPPLPRPFSPLNSQNVRNYDVLPDGQHFLGVVPAGQTTSGQTGPVAAQIQVVLNWFEDVKQRMTER